MTNNEFYSLILILSALIFGWILALVSAVVLKGRLKSISIRGLNLQLNLLSRPLRVLLPTICLVFVMPFLEISDVYLKIILHLTRVLIIFSIGWLIIRVVALAKEAILSRYDISASDNLRARQIYTQMRVLQNVINVIVGIITFAVILMTFTRVREIGVSLLASAGVFGIVIGFAAQKTLGNLIAGIQLAITQPIRIDDVVIIEGEWGWVEEINLTFVVVRIWDLRRLVVPLSYFMEKPFQNWTRTSADILGTVFLYVDYSIDVDAVREELGKILQDHPKWDKKVNVLQVTNTSEKTLELRALMSSANSPAAWELRCDVREKLLKFLQEKYPNALPKVRLIKESLKT